MKHRDKVVLNKVLSEVKIGLELFSNISYDDFSNDEKTKRAICMTAINVGELIKILTDDIRLKYKNVLWKAIAGFRDIAAHKYEALDMKDVYDTVKDDFPILVESIKKILKDDSIDEKDYA